MTVPPLNEFIRFVMYEWAGAHDVPCFFVGVSLGGAEHSLAGPFSNQSSGLRLDRDANDYRPGDGERVGTPLARVISPRPPPPAARPPRHRSAHLARSARRPPVHLGIDVRCGFPRTRDRRYLERATFVEFAGRG